MTSNPLVSIVIPNWNGKRFLVGCLDSIRRQSYPSIETIIVDNGSQDGSVELITESYPEVRLIRFDTNTGFSPAVNAGIRSARGEFIALLNNDTVAEPLWVEELVKALRRHPEVGSVGCKMRTFDDPAILDGVGDAYPRGGLPGRIGHGERDVGRFDEPRFILGACGGAAMYRRSMFDDIGVFDDDYFAYVEDVDLALRAQSAGYKCLYVPTACVYHVGCGSTGSGFSPMVVRLTSQNNVNTIVKNLPAPLLLRFLPRILLAQLYYLGVVTIRSGRAASWFIGTGRALRLLPRMLKKRAEIGARRRVSLDYLETIMVESGRDLAATRKRLRAQNRPVK
jgi:hypothetical protein